MSLARARRLFAAPNRDADLFAPVTQPMRAWPWLCDFQGHVNNARYLDLMSSGRLEWLVHNGLFRAIFRERIGFLVAGVGGVYRRPIPHLAEFVLQTRLASYDVRWLEYEHTFWLGSGPRGSIAARFVVRGALRTRHGPLEPRESLRRCGVELPAAQPAPPADLEAWSAAQTLCLGVMRAHDSDAGRSRR